MDPLQQKSLNEAVRMGITTFAPMCAEQGKRYRVWYTAIEIGQSLTPELQIVEFVGEGLPDVQGREPAPVSVGRASNGR